MMYVPYKCCEKSFEEYYVNQTGNGIPYYQGSLTQSGYGLGGLFRSLFRAAVPMLKSGAKAIGKQLFHSGVNILSDVSRGENLKLATKRRMKEAGRELTDRAAVKMKTMIGSGHNKKRKQKKKPVISRKVKKARTPDIFS